MKLYRPAVCLGYKNPHSICMYKYRSPFTSLQFPAYKGEEKRKSLISLVHYKLTQLIDSFHPQAPVVSESYQKSPF